MNARERLAAVMPEHQAWCHGEAHAECCGAGDCDCGVSDALDALLPVVERIAAERAEEELRAAADEVRDNHGTASLSAKRIDARAAALDGA